MLNQEIKNPNNSEDINEIRKQMYYDELKNLPEKKQQTRLDTAHRKNL